MPSTVWVTVKIPRGALKVFTNGDPTEIGTVPIHCTVQGSLAATTIVGGWQNIFEAVQTGFGNLSTSGTRYTNDFRVMIADNPESWGGKACLFASFMAPSWMLLKEPNDAEVTFGVQSTPYTVIQFLPRLGIHMTVFKAKLGNTDHVYVSKHPPNQSGNLVVGGLRKHDIISPETSSSGTQMSLEARFDSKTGSLASLTGRLDINSNALEQELAGGASVQSIPLTPCTHRVSIGNNNFDVVFPVPVIGDKCKTRIARKSSYIELVVPVVTRPGSSPSMSLTCPIVFDQGIPTNLNLPYVNLQASPAINAQKRGELKWLNLHVSTMFSQREGQLRKDRKMPAFDGERARLGLKDSVHMLFNCFCGLEGAKRCSVFALDHPEGGGVHILLFVSAIRLDVANRTVILDMAVLPLYTEIMPKLTQFLKALTTRGVRMIKVDGGELMLWKQVLPAYVERCRMWKHHDACEYAIVGGMAPVSVDKGMKTLCTCGNGVFPDNYIVHDPLWKMVSGHCVRAAVSPMFHCPLVDDVFDFVSSLADVIDVCCVCHKTKGEGGAELKVCAQCRAVKYCSTQCQRADWKKHKVTCVANGK